ncbi:hypothetical protein ARMGADRAFT_1169842 [Armillaria gallica]|uniref:Uncharacterized protein n=1 Tax=Armillaria gallica TaxID=47427 RepID=A0A2H3CPF2_ARMGA|nr:hypothetical protein ARMGADRAFT_1169842 [Armillaria gallica]
MYGFMSRVRLGFTLSAAVALPFLLYDSGFDRTTMAFHPSLAYMVSPVLEVYDSILNHQCMGRKPIHQRREGFWGGWDDHSTTVIVLRSVYVELFHVVIHPGYCCCPTLILVGGGPYFTVLGVVWTNEFIVQRLTDIIVLVKPRRTKYRLSRPYATAGQALNPFYDDIKASS